MRKIVFAVSAAAVALSPVMATADCFTETEWRAAHVRVLQTELNVAQLECSNVVGANYDVQYQNFIEKFKDRLKADALLLRAHFKRVYGKGSEAELDKFVTKVANDASGRSMSDLKFCANSAGLFTQAMAIEMPQFEQAAVDRVTDHSEVGDECPVKAVVAKASTKAAVPVQSAQQPAAKKASGTTSSTKPSTTTTTATNAG